MARYAASPIPLGGRRGDPTRINRPAFTTELAADWLAAMPNVIARLECARHARVADLGCGQGWSTIALANAFLNAWVDGFDSDRASIADARRHAAEAGLDGRVRFSCADAAELATRGPYDLILLHDVARPVGALAAVRTALVSGGTALAFENDFFRLYRLWA